ncbi:hypothetical protein CAOG_00335 [Capsaspora owczarzaki ATCC 30864]|uniref:hypothetical protein n=1 Tax=Capsaspora owczarzaki (strain ATCC 30864) TaxID=595528 RepID=UPI0003526B2D|nr:hypothetical protein CAOG_00335 [Capsaspora owczarzaki ATCC 30864]|eukprot:XP_004365206.2 hypothetical protein CAOG_00335 [Capsaspora owczarzaki ATCC 30864]
MPSYQSMTRRQREWYDRVKNVSGWLQLDNQDIHCDDAEAIVEALRVNKSVTAVILYHNWIRAVGAQSIAEFLKEDTTLTYFSLWSNQIGDVGAQAIAEALKVSKTRAALDLHGNSIGDAGAHAIAEALKVNTTLTNLDLADNQIGDAGALAIADALKVNTTLIGLGLTGNFFTDVGVTAVTQTGNTTCRFRDPCRLEAGLERQRVPSAAELAQIAARAAANAQPLNLATEVDQLRFWFAAKDQTIAAKEQELAGKNEEIAAKEQKLAAKDQELKSALDRIALLERNQPTVGSTLSFEGPIPQVPLATLVTATNNFAADSLLGEGAFGRVHGASLPGPRVAIKKLSAASPAEFKSELDSLSKFRHPNIITILSYAEEGDTRCLVYEFMPNGAVRDRLNRTNDTPSLTWSQRHRIAADVARGMHYVQTAFPDHALFHLDLKTDNVLLDAYFNAKVSDFGLVRAAQHLDEKSYIRTDNVQGSAPYMCPEFFEEGRMTIKTDVYAFGMILLELVTAEKPGTKLKSKARKAAKSQKPLEMLDSTLKPAQAELQSVCKVVTLALECLEESADERPAFGCLLVSLDS